MDIQVGAKIVVNLKKKNILTLEEAERLLAFTNNSGPLFIVGTVGISLLNDVRIGYILLISHLLSCIIVGIVFRNWKNNKKSTPKSFKNEIKNEVKINELGEVLSNSIKNSIETITMIGGFIVLFSVIISILNSSKVFEISHLLCSRFNISEQIGNGIVTGIIELTNGLKELALVPITKISICIISSLIGFGGLSIFFQVYSIISKEKISIKTYLYGKILQGFFSFIITGLLF